MGYFLQYLFARALTALLALLPWSWVESFARGCGSLAFLFYGSRRKIALANLDYAFGQSRSPKEKEALARAAFQHMALSLVEFFLMPKSLATAAADFHFTGLEHAEAAFACGKGVILVISHLGSWEYLAMLPYLTGQPWSVVVKTIRNPFLDRHLNAMRRMTTLQPIEKKGSTRAVLQALKGNRGVAILIDQWAGPEGIWQPFFGHETATTSVPARLAKKTGCVLVAAYCLRRANHQFEIQIHSPVPHEQVAQLDETVLTNKLNELLETQIRRYPEQWSWGHRRWKPKPAVSRAVSRSMPTNS